MSQFLSMYTIYANPRDYPGEFVARRHEIRPGLSVPMELVARGKTLDEVRDRLPEGLTRLPRDPMDEVQIIETWV